MANTEGSVPFGVLLRQYRVAAGFSQEALAERAGVSRRGISDLERGERRLPHPSTVRRLGEALELAPEARATLLSSSRAHETPIATPRRAPSAPAAARSQLPSAVSSFVGRQRELAELATTIARVRLLTLTGPGGVGKTRLAVQLAEHVRDQFEDDVVFVGLASIQDAELVVPTLAQGLGLEGDASWSPGALIREALAGEQLLVVLDNFEHVLEAASWLAELLEACPRVKALVTSRAPLRVRGEQEFSVPPLSLPERAQVADPPALARSDAVRLLVERARSVDPGFGLTGGNADDLAEICRQLDGLPLAIELAAARLRAMSVHGVLARLEHRLVVLTGGARDLPARHQTLRATIAWSYDLLDAAQQVLFRRIAVFVGGFTLAAVRSIAGGPAREDGQLPPPSDDLVDLLDSLLAASLVQADPSSNRDGQSDAEPRFSMLETIREFGLERLGESGEEAALRRRHASAYLSFAERAREQLTGADQGLWLARLEAEHGNLRGSLDTWMALREPERASRLVDALQWFWIVHGHLAEGVERTVRAADLAGAMGRLDLQAMALEHGGLLAFNLGNYALARELVGHSVDIRRRLGDPSRTRSALVDLAAAELKGGDAQSARGHLEESVAIARQTGDTVSYTRSVNDLANLAHEQADYARARALYAEGVALARQNDDLAGLATVLNNLAIVARDQGDLDEASRIFEESIGIRRTLGDRHGLGLTLANLGEMLGEAGEYATARARLTESLEIQRDLGAEPSVAMVLERLACLAAAFDRPLEALRLAGAAIAQRARIGVIAAPAARQRLDDRLALVRGSLDAAAAASAWHEGLALSRDAAIGFALAPDSDPSGSASRPR